MTALNHPQILSRMTSNDRIRLVGEVTTLLLASNLHVKYLVSDIKSEFLTPIDYNQFRIYKIGKDPVALVETMAVQVETVVFFEEAVGEDSTAA